MQDESFEVYVKIETIVGVPSMKRHTLLSNECRYVYFLSKAGSIVYVGQTGSIDTRLKDHVRAKDFDDVHFLEVPKGETNDVEQAFIRAISPPLNRAALGKVTAYDVAILSRYNVAHLVETTPNSYLSPATQYGSVLIVEGPHAGKVGYYDDDTTECECLDEFDEEYGDVSEDTYLELFESRFECVCGEYEKGIVYFGPMNESYYLIPMKYIRSLPEGDPRTPEMEANLMSCFKGIAEEDEGALQPTQTGFDFNFDHVFGQTKTE